MAQSNERKFKIADNQKMWEDYADKYGIEFFALEADFTINDGADGSKRNYPRGCYPRAQPPPCDRP